MSGYAPQDLDILVFGTDEMRKQVTAAYFDMLGRLVISVVAR